MMYAEGILIALAAPLLILLFFASRETRKVLLFMVVGMLSSLVSAYFNSFLSGVMRVDGLDAVIVVAPMVEEVFKFLPLVFFFVVFEPGRQGIVDAALALGAGFALFENTSYLSNLGLQNVLLLVLRGLSAGAMHASCTVFVGLGLYRSRRESWPPFTAMSGVMVIAIIYHGVYNLVVSFPGPLRLAGYGLPLVFALAMAFFQPREPRKAA